MKFILLIFTLGVALLNAQDTQIQRFVLLAAANDGGAERPMLRYANTDAKSIAQVLEDMGGVSWENRIHISEPTPDALRHGLDQMEARLKSTPKTGRKEVLIYYSGHADERGLLLGGKRLPWRELRDRVEALSADVRITILDACGSGAIVRAKGGQRRPAFLLDESSNMKGTAFLTSSTGDEVSQESDRLKASFFTHALVSGLRGAADLNGDKKVTLGEAYQFAFQETLSSTESTTGGTQHPSRDMNLSGSGDVVLTDVRGSVSALVLPKDLQGKITIRDHGQQLVAELQKNAGREIEIGLSPGKYKVRIEQQSTQESTLEISSKERLRLDLSKFSKIKTESTRNRGGQALPPNSWQAKAETLSDSSYLGIIKSTLDSTARGFQLSGFFNSASQGFVGQQISLWGANFASSGFEGMQLSSLVNIAGGQSSSMQISGGLNYAEIFKGIQLGYINLGIDVSGVQGGFLNIASDRQSGIQGGLINLSLGTTQGVQGGLVNLSLDSVHAVQGGMLNVGIGSTRGIQVGMINHTSGSLHGMQAGMINLAGWKGNGVQMGMINLSGNSSMQIGMINVAQDTKLPIGLINFVGTGIYGMRSTLDEMQWTTHRFFSGTPWFYTGMEWSQRELNPKKYPSAYGMGFSIGTRFGEQGPFWFSLESTTRWMQEWEQGLFDTDWKSIQEDTVAVRLEMESQVFNTLNRLEFNMGYNLTSWIGISAGMSANLLQTWGNPVVELPMGNWHGRVPNEKDMLYWTGFQASVQIGQLGEGIF